MRYGLCALIILLSAFAMYRLSLRLMGQAHYLKAGELLREGYPGLALSRLEKAVRNDPGDHEIRKALGRVHYELGALQYQTVNALDFALKSRESYGAAAKLNPLDAHAAYGVARAENRLAELYRRRYPEKTVLPYEPGPYFQTAIHLRPNGILYRYAHVQYLHHRGRHDELASAVRRLTRIYPPSYHYLRREAFWSQPVREACREGLKGAVKDNIMTKEAHTALSAMMARDRQWSAAIDQYQAALRHRAFDNNADNYRRLGELYLKNGQFEEARNCFFRALHMTRSRDREMARLYHLYRNQKHLDRFERFYRDADQRLILPTGTQILLARTLMDLKQYHQARRILEEMVQKRPDAAGYYWLAHIAQAEKDWDAMELAIQKATVLEPENSAYHLLFSRVLKRMKKLQRAEREADLAIRYEKRPFHPGLLNHRAWIRWTRGDFSGALQDWTRALRVDPDNAPLHAHAAEAHLKLGHDAAAVKHYEKAVQLDPENQRYRDRFRKMQKKRTSNIER